MAEEDQIEQGDTEEEESGSQSGKKLGFIIALAVLLIGGGLGAAYFFGLFGGSHEEGDEDATHAEGEAGAAVEAKITYYTLPEFLVNLSSSTNQTSFIKMKVTLEMPSEQDRLIAEERLPRLQDIINTYLRDLRPSDLAGTAGMYRLKEELLARTNKVLAPEAKANHILFTEILIQ